MSIKVLIADDHTLVREGIKALLKERGEIEVIDSCKYRKRNHLKDKRIKS